MSLNAPTQGEHCQEDIDECLLGPAVHQCGRDSRCVNRFEEMLIKTVLLSMSMAIASELFKLSKSIEFWWCCAGHDKQRSPNRWYASGPPCLHIDPPLIALIDIAPFSRGIGKMISMIIWSVTYWLFPHRPGWFYCALEEGFTSYRNPLTQVANFAAKIENPTLNTAGDLLHGRWRVLWGPAHLPSFDHLPVHPQRVRCHQLFKCISTPSNKSPLVPILALFDPFSCNQLTCSTSYFFILPHHLSFRWSWRYSSTTSAASPMIPAPAIDGRHWDPQKVPWAAAFIGPWGFSSAVIDRKHREKDA